MGCVDFLHRTVSDFLRTAEMADFIEGRTKPDFNPYVSMLQAYIARIKHRLSESLIIQQDLSSALDSVLLGVEASGIDPFMPYLYHLDMTISTMSWDCGKGVQERIPVAPYPPFFKETAFAAGLVEYVSREHRTRSELL